MYLFYGKLIFENDKIVLEYSDKNGNTIKIQDLESYIKSKKEKC